MIQSKSIQFDCSVNEYRKNRNKEEEGRDDAQTESRAFNNCVNNQH